VTDVSVLRALTLTAAVAVVLLWLIDGAATSPTAAAVDHEPAFASSETAFGGLTQTQEDAQDAASGNDDRVPVQVWTVFAAGGAAAVCLVLYLLRLALGLVKPPPPEQEEAHH
jgi:hypothetical protein